MPIGLVAGCAGAVITTRAVQLYNAIPAAQRGTWRIFYFDENSHLQEYTRRDFNNAATVDVAAQTHCFIFCHGRYDSTHGNRSTGLSRWDIDDRHADFDATVYTDWLTSTGTGITTVKVAACHAGDVGAGHGNIPIQDIVAVREGMHADGPNTALLALGGVDVDWRVAGAPAGWTRF